MSSAGSIGRRAKRGPRPAVLYGRLPVPTLIEAAAQLAYKFVLLAAGIEQTRFVLAQLMTSSAARLPVAAQARLAGNGPP